MKRTNPAFLLAACFFVLFAWTSCKKEPPQILEDVVQSSCEDPNTLSSYYAESAELITLRTIQAISNHNWNDSIQLYQEHIQVVLDILIAVHNADGLKGRDEVILDYGIMAQGNPVLNQIVVVVDTSYAWTQQWDQGITMTGDPQMDQILTDYQLTLFGRTGLFPGSYTFLESPINLNMKALGTLIETVPGVDRVEESMIIGGGNDIHLEWNRIIGKAYLSYEYAWGDCPSGCIYSHYWDFSVDDACEVAYLGERGADLP